MKRLAKILPVLFLMPVNCFAQGMTAAAAQRASSMGLVYNLTISAADLTKNCGPAVSQYLVASVRARKSSLEIQEGLAKIPASVFCQSAQLTYKILSNEVYRRTHATLIQQQQAVAKLPQYQNLNAVILNAETAAAPDYIKVLSQDSDSVLVGGEIPSGVVIMALKVIKDGDASSSWFAISADNPKEWSHRVYLRQGAGHYKIDFLTSVVAANPYSNRTEYNVSGEAEASLSTDVNPTLEPSDQVQSNDPAIVALSKTIIANALTDRQKAQAIHDWVAANITYDYVTLQKLNSGENFEAANGGASASALLTLKKKSGICEEYAFLAAALLRSANIQGKVIYGDTPRGSHAWNQAFVDGHWINIDTTWDAPRSDDFYFDTATDVFAKDHTNGVDAGV